MVPNDSPEMTLDPVEMLNDCLERAWDKICDTYDASASLPEMQILFEGADLSRPASAAEGVLINMLLEVMESICRFSPWYTKPPRAFGLTKVRDTTSNRSHRIMAPEASQKWDDFLKPLGEMIRKYGALIQAVLLVEGLMAKSNPDDPIVTACCSCIPPRAIQIRHSALVKVEILCERCRQPYLL
jgi:hypothetical protein